MDWNGLWIKQILSSDAMDSLRLKLNSIRAAELARDDSTGATILGVSRRARYEINDFVSHPDLSWFRETVADVREAMQPSECSIAIRHIEVYERLIQRQRRSLSERMGAVVFGARPALYITPSSIINPRVLFVEVAHCLNRKAQISELDAGLRYYFESIHEPDSYISKSEVWLPILSQLEIFQAFLRSRSYAKCSDIDRHFAQRVVHALQMRGDDESNIDVLAAVRSNRETTSTRIIVGAVLATALVSQPFVEDSSRSAVLPVLPIERAVETDGGGVPSSIATELVKSTRDNVVKTDPSAPGSLPSHSRLRSIIRGIGTVLEIFPKEERFDIRRRLSEVTDIEAIQRDWECIASDLRTVANTHGNKS